MSEYYSAHYKGLRETLIKVLAHCDAYIDFQEDDSDIKENMIDSVKEDIR